MSTAKATLERIKRLEKGEPFSNAQFLKLGSRAAADKSLSRLVATGVIHRLARGVFVRPKRSRFVGYVVPDLHKVVEVIANSRGETVQVHGAEAARRFRLTTQVPTIPVYCTNGPSREMRLGNQVVKFRHVSSQRKLSMAGERSGVALSALWYLGKEAVNKEVIKKIRNGLTAAEFAKLEKADMPGWMSDAIRCYNEEMPSAGQAE